MPILHRDLFYLEERVLAVGTIGFHHDVVEFPGNVEILGVLHKSADLSHPSRTAGMISYAVFLTRNGLLSF